jgi:hypothetical protein
LNRWCFFLSVSISVSLTLSLFATQSLRKYLYFFICHPSTLYSKRYF